MADKISKDEWSEWLHNPVTEEFLVYISDKINSETFGLVENAGESPFKDARTSGRIMAFGEMINWKPETILEEIDEIVVVGEQEEEEDE